LGRKQIGKRQCFHFFIACLIIIIFSGCASFSGNRIRMAANDHLEKGQILFEQGDFEEASKENQRVLSLIDRGEPADRALFNMGLIYAHQDNPDRDYVRAVELFKRVLEEYPDSPLYNHAKVLFYVLNDNMKSKTRIENLSGINDYLLQNDELNDNMKSKTRIENQSGINDYLPQNDELIKINDFNKALDVNQQALSVSENGQRLDKVLFNIGFIYAHHDNPDKNYKLSIEYFERLIKEYPQSPLIDQAKVWQGLLNIIEKSKQVDIEIDQKKKELAR